MREIHLTIHLFNPELPTIEINFGNQVWPGTRPKYSDHYHVGYVTFRDSISMKYTPELKYTREGTNLNIDHIDEFKFDKRPRPIVKNLEKVKKEYEIIEIDYKDPFHRKGIMFYENVKGFKGSILRLLGYKITESDEFIWIGLGKFEYEDGIKDYETVHVIPKEAIINLTYFNVTS